MADKETTYTVILREKQTSIGTFKIPQNLYDRLVKELEPYRTHAQEAKKIRCIETGQIFKSAREASHWVMDNNKIEYCDMNLIKQTCKGKQLTSYGFHWEFVT